MRLTSLTAISLCLTVALTGCSSTGDSSSGDSSAGGPGTAPAAASSPAGAVSDAAADAATIIERLEAAGLGLTHVAVQDEDTDPNNLIGRPGGYTSRASADLPGGDTEAEKYDAARGLVAEVFADAASASRRAKYIEGLQRDSPILGTEYHYFTVDGTGLIRVSGQVKPSAAKKIGAAVADQG